MASFTICALININVFNIYIERERETERLLSLAKKMGSFDLVILILNMHYNIL